MEPLDDGGERLAGGAEHDVVRRAEVLPRPGGDAEPGAAVEDEDLGAASPAADATSYEALPPLGFEPVGYVEDEELWSRSTTGANASPAAPNTT